MNTSIGDYVITQDLKDCQEADWFGTRMPTSIRFHNINDFNRFIRMSWDTVVDIDDIKDTWNWKYRVVNGETILNIESQRDIELPDWHETGCLSDLFGLDMGSNNV